MTGPLPVVPATARVDFIWSSSGDTDIMNRLFFSYSGGAPSPSDAATIASELFTAMTGQDGQWGNDVAMTECIFTDLSAVSGAQGIHGGNAPGGKSAGALSGSTALLVNYHIARRYRGGKPRSYLPWLVETDLTDRRNWNAAAVTTAVTALEAFMSIAIGTTGGSTVLTNHVNVSYYSGFDVVTNPITGRARNVSKRRTTPVVDVITGITGSTRPGSQRRRN